MASDEGGRRKELSEYALSGTVSTVLREARALQQETGAPLDTGRLLVALVQRGATAADDHYAPRVLRSLSARMSENRFEGAVGYFLSSAKSEEEPSAGPGSPSVDVSTALEAAARLPQHDGILAARHLVVGLLTHVMEAGAKTSAGRLLQSAKVDARGLLVAFLATLPQFAPEPERAEWAKLLRQLRGVVRSGSPLRPVFDTDTPHGSEAHDCLDLSATVSAMANLIASPHLDGNLSLGVFGNWGSGKSFFMRRLRDAITELSALARSEAEQQPAEPPAYWQNVVQVEFNAWHYVDANLWASLVSHLLEELSRLSPRSAASKPGEGGVKSPARPALDLALSQLRLATDARNEATRVQQKAESARDDAKVELDRAGEKAADAAKALARAAAAPIWANVREKVEQTLDETAIAESLATLGLTLDADSRSKTQPDSLRPLYDQIREVTSVVGRTHAVFERTLRAEGGGRALLQSAALVVVPLVLVIALSYLLETQRELMLTVGATVAGLVGAAARSAKWVRDQAVVVTKALEPLNAARRRIAAALDEAEAEKATLVSELEKTLALRNVELEAARKAVAARETQVQDAAQAVSATISGTAIARFIEQRLASSDYQKHLGLIAVIRRDFEQLSQLILGHNAQRLRLSADVTRIQAELHLALPELSAEDLQKMLQNLGVNRIVIYIDDLDRCPSERVVEVLQAIHLLLAFPVFVVVVGVDARWMSHSLAKEYPSMLARRTPSHFAETSEWLGRVSPSDYLEKIFQIPFWVPPLDATATKLLLGRLTGVSRPEEATTSSSRVSSKHPSSEGVYRPSAPATPTTKAAGAPRTSSPQAASSRPSTTRKEPSTLARPEALTCTESELQAMQELALVIGRSPRATKRFVNCYRLLKAALTETELLRLKDDELGGLTAPMFMLAVVTGAPNLSGSFLSDEPTTVRTPFEHLRALAAAPTHDADTYDTSLRIRDFCASGVPARWQEITFEERRRWATRVAQFAFDDLTTGPLPPLAPPGATVTMPPSSATQPMRAATSS
jgi:KAP family P-loop domain